MLLKILGCGTSTGIPIPGCDCNVCTSTNPRNTRFKTSALLIGGDGQHLLIDVSTDFRHQALRAKIAAVDAALFTHSHADHILGIDDLRAYNFIKRQPIPCFGSNRTLNDIRRVFHYIFADDRQYEGGPIPQLELIDVEDFKPFEAAGMKVLPFPLIHGRTPVSGFRIGRFAYATDCKIVPPESRAFLGDLDVLVLDGLRFEPHKTHMTIPEAVECATQLGAKKTYLTHMTHSVEYEEVSATLPPHVELAYDGLEVTIRE